MAIEKDLLIDKFADLSFGSEQGLGTWLSEQAHPLVLQRLGRLDREPLTKVQFNQLLVVSQMASISDGLFRYYWRNTPEHPYEVKAIGHFDGEWIKGTEHVILSIDHLLWGLYRLYIDGLLYYGNVKAAFISLRSLTYGQIAEFFREKRFDTEAIAARGPALALNVIGRDDRYLISEMACKTFGDLPATREAALSVLEAAWEKHAAAGGGDIDFRELLKRYVVTPTTEEQLLLSYDDISNEKIRSKGELKTQFASLASKFLDARSKAIQNTEYYLSMVNDLDVYVATSMRTRKNFRDMADASERIF